MTDLIGWEGDLPLATFAATTPLRPSPTKMSTFVMRLTTRLSPSAENDSDKHISCTSTGRRALGREGRLPQILSTPGRRTRRQVSLTKVLVRFHIEPHCEQRELG